MFIIITAHFYILKSHAACWLTLLQVPVFDNLGFHRREILRSRLRGNINSSIELKTVLSSFQTSQEYQMFVEECQPEFQKFICFFRGQILRACAYYSFARLSTTWKFYASDQTVGHGLK